MEFERQGVPYFVVVAEAFDLYWATRQDVAQEMEGS